MDKVGQQTFGSILQTLHAWRMPLVLISLLAIVLGLIFSLPTFITPKYESSVVMLPASTRSLAEALLSSNIWSETDILEFGERRHADQLIQVLESNKIQDKIISHYDLWTHYDINPDLPYARTRLQKVYDRNIQFRRTEFNAVEVSVLDKDPQQAAEMANMIANLLDSTIHKIQEKRAQKAIEVAEYAYHAKEQYIQKLEDSLMYIMTLGVHDYESQAQVLYEQLAIRLATQQTQAAQAIEAKLDHLALLGGPYVSIMEELKLEKERLSHLKSKVEKARMDAYQDLPQKFIVSDAFKAERKSYPLQWVIMTGAGLSALLFALIIILYYPRMTRLFQYYARETKQGSSLMETT